MLEKRKVAIFTGGTMVHIRPHFAVCAPAFGTVGREISAALGEHFDISLYTSYMAGGKDFNTNDDLKALLEQLLEALPEKSVIIMAAAVCDFEPAYLTEHKPVECSHIFGKEHPRLSSSGPISITFSPTEKLVRIIKERRPDITLVTFKTAAGESQDTLIEMARHNIEATGANIVFANDIVNHCNVLVFPTVSLQGSRQSIIHNLKHYL